MHGIRPYFVQNHNQFVIYSAQCSMHNLVTAIIFSYGTCILVVFLISRLFIYSMHEHIPMDILLDFLHFMETLYYQLFLVLTAVEISNNMFIATYI